MKYLLTISALIVAISITACAASKSKKSKKLNITSITVERGACFGRCPSYMLNIQSNGNVHYDGKMFSQPSGSYTYKLAPEKVASLFAKAAKLRVDTCKNEYEVMISDFPGLDLTFIINGKEKHISNARFGPEFLSNFAKEVDAAIKVDSTTWKKIADFTPPQ